MTESSSASPGGGGRLAHTGTAVALAALVGVAALFAGVVLVRLARRSRHG
ncbi:hypothetical protein OG196_00975 [Kitasatospora purpeofusca]|nr:hypothetical protein OG715_00435 [Kitasatospora purpeofusca]WSR37784.1 hypothetical protein OG196_00975 [Kitasatospora purpeofusca]